jgi:hypothetical protein
MICNDKQFSIDITNSLISSPRRRSFIQAGIRRKQPVLELPIMTVTLELEPEVELTATEQAREEGLPLAVYVEAVVKEAIFRRQKIQRLAEKSFDEILEPFRNEVETSGASDDELDNLFRQARREASQARREK